MDAFSIGGLVIAVPRFYAGVALLALIFVAELAAWRRRRATPTGPADGAAWAWTTAGAVLIGSRTGFVLENLGFFSREPLATLYFWQGGFSPWWGVAAGVATTFWAFRRQVDGLRTAVGPAAVSLAVWLVVPALLSPSPAEAGMLPALVVERLEGGALDLAELKGKPVVINLWATWCPPCRRELPQFAQAAVSYPDVHFVYANQGQGRDVVVEYLAERQDVRLTNVVLDQGQVIGERFGSLGLPTTYFFDADGNHVLTHVGEVSAVALINHLADLRR